MAIDDSEVSKIARLARLRFDAPGRKKIAAELDAVLVHIHKLEELDTDAVQPMSQVHSESHLRADTAAPGLNLADALRNAPDPITTEDGGLFSVPKVLD